MINCASYVCYVCRFIINVLHEQVGEASVECFNKVNIDKETKAILYQSIALKFWVSCSRRNIPGVFSPTFHAPWNAPWGQNALHGYADVNCMLFTCHVLQKKCLSPDGHQRTPRADVLTIELYCIAIMVLTIRQHTYKCMHSMVTAW